MPRQCLYCDNTADSREHLWSDWVLRSRDKVGGWGPIRHSIAGSETKILPNPELKVGTVCESCNTGWMHRLEDLNKPLIGCLMQDISTPLDVEQQHGLAL